MRREYSKATDNGIFGLLIYFQILFTDKEY